MIPRPWTSNSNPQGIAHPWPEIPDATVVSPSPLGIEDSVILQTQQALNNAIVQLNALIQQVNAIQRTLAVIPINRGGTALTTIGTADQVLGVKHTGGALEYKTIAQGTGITVTDAAGSITIAVSGASVSDFIAVADGNADGTHGFRFSNATDANHPLLINTSTTLASNWVSIPILGVGFSTLPAQALEVAGNVLVDNGYWLTVPDVYCNRIFPYADSATALQVVNYANSYVVMDVDTTNFRVGIYKDHASYTAPSDTLDVYGTVYISDTLKVTNISNTGTIEILGTGAGAYVYFAGATYSVGINTPSPAYTLDVTGTAHVTGAVTLDSTITVASTVECDGYFRGQVLEGTSAAHFVTIRPYSGVGHTDSTSGVVVQNSSAGVVCAFDTTNSIVYPTHLVLPTS